MRRFRIVLLPLAVASTILLSSERPAAWGVQAHPFAEKAIAFLPAEIRPYFQKHLGFMVEHAISKFGRDMVQKYGLLPWRVDET